MFEFIKKIFKEDNKKGKHSDAFKNVKEEKKSQTQTKSSNATFTKVTKHVRGRPPKETTIPRKLIKVH